MNARSVEDTCRCRGR